jgi:hypothetical protein
MAKGGKAKEVEQDSIQVNVRLDKDMIKWLQARATEEGLDGKHTVLIIRVLNLYRSGKLMDPDQVLELMKKDKA